MKNYEVDISFIARESDLLKITATCQGQAEKLALEVAEDLNPHGEEFKIDYIEEIK